MFEDEIIDAEPVTDSGPAVATSAVSRMDEAMPPAHRSVARCQCNAMLGAFQVTRSQQSRTCCSCSAALEYRKFAYRCAACYWIICKTCAASRRNCTDTPPAEGIHDSDTPPLLESLRQLPEAFPTQTMLWVPRRSKQTASEVLRQLLRDATARPQPQQVTQRRRLLTGCCGQVPSSCSDQCWVNQ